MLIKLCKSIFICAMLVLPLTAASPVKADESFNLIVNGGVIVPWNISNIAPGSHGTFGVDIRNAGAVSGFISIWINGIIDAEGVNPESETGDTGEPGELSQYLTLNITGPFVAPYTETPCFGLPVTLSQFPGSVLSPLMLHDQLLEPGVTIHVQWEWAVPPETTNIIQGDRVTFDIHYLLTSELLIRRPIIPGGGGGGSTRDDTDSDTQDEEIDEINEDIADTDVEPDEQHETDTDGKELSDNTSTLPTEETDITDDSIVILPYDHLQPAPTKPEESQRKIDLGDISSAEKANIGEVFSQVSLIVAVIAVSTMIILAVTVRKRRKNNTSNKVKG